MRHPFDLNPSDLETCDLEFEELLPPEESAQVGGGLTYTTLALGEEGGSYPPIDWYPNPCPRPPKPHPIDPPVATTLAIGEEGGSPPIASTKALGEEGGGIFW